MTNLIERAYVVRQLRMLPSRVLIRRIEWHSIYEEANQCDWILDTIGLDGIPDPASETSETDLRSQQQKRLDVLW
jgi:hypothetical protein